MAKTDSLHGNVTSLEVWPQSVLPPGTVLSSICYFSPQRLSNMSYAKLISQNTPRLLRRLNNQGLPNANHQKKDALGAEKKAVFTAKLLETASWCALQCQFQQSFLFTSIYIPLLKHIITLAAQLFLNCKSSLMLADLLGGFCKGYLLVTVQQAAIHNSKT